MNQMNKSCSRHIGKKRARVDMTYGRSFQESNANTEKMSQGEGDIH